MIPWLQEGLGSAPGGRTTFFSEPRVRAEHSDTNATAAITFNIESPLFLAFSSGNRSLARKRYATAKSNSPHCNRVFVGVAEKLDGKSVYLARPGCDMAVLRRTGRLPAGSFYSGVVSHLGRLSRMMMGGVAVIPFSVPALLRVR